jgi:sugar lactone lactonase YvrE
MKIFRGKFDLLEIALLDGFSVNDDENIWCNEPQQKLSLFWSTGPIYNPQI